MELLLIDETPRYHSKIHNIGKELINIFNLGPIVYLNYSIIIWNN